LSILSGKTAIITGGANGQGAAAARLFAAQGAKVVIADVAVAPGEHLAEEIGPSARFVSHDVSSAESWRHVIDFSLEAFSRIDVLMNNAGIYEWRSLQDTDEELLERMWRVNELGVFLGMKSVIEPMARQGSGSIINVSSIGGARGFPGIFAYATTKWAIRGMTKCAARDLGQYGIRVNGILPGVIDTQMIAHLPHETKESWLASMPLGRLGQPRDVAQVAVFLASEASAYMTGTDLVVDAGMSA
jgi:3alpha(or 20beta)-hydroxysteroid dehydrogenase